MAVTIFCSIVLVGLLILYRKKVQEAIENINDRFGGPPNPMAPLPSTDAHLLLKRPRKKSAVL